MEAKLSVRMDQSLADAYTEAAELLGMDRSTLVRQVLEQGAPALRAVIASMKAVQAGTPLEALDAWRGVVGQVVNQSRSMAADVVGLEAEMRAAADADTRGTGLPGPAGGSAPLEDER